MIAPSSGKRVVWAAVIIVLILCSVLGAQAQEKKKKFTKKDVPAAVLSAFGKAFPKAIINGVDKEQEHGTTYYEIESMDGKTKRDLLYTAAGKVYETEETVEASAMPNEIKATLSKEYPKAKVAKAEKVTRESTVEYELQLTIGKEKKEIVFDATGKIVKPNKSESDKEKNEKDEEEDDDDNE